MKKITLLTIIFGLTLSGCMTNGAKAPVGGSSAATILAQATATPVASSGPVAFNLVVATPLPSPATSTQPVLSITVNSISGLNNIDAFCTQYSSASVFSTNMNNLSCGSNAASPYCSCVFQWSVNSTTQTVHTPVTYVSSNFVQCPLPTQYSDTTTNFPIPDASQVTLSIAQTSSICTDSQVLATGSFVKNSTLSSGAYVDDNGYSLSNVSHYSCYEKFQRPRSIKSAAQQATDSSASSTTGSYNTLYATQFCFQTMGGSSASTQNCLNQLTSSDVDYSVQSFYYNLYTTTPSYINPSNDRYYCPQVNNPIKSGGQQFWPLDSTLSLANVYSPKYSVPIQAPSLLSSGNAVNTITSVCAIPGASPNPSGGSSGSQNSSISSQCLGFALRPNSDGSCPNITIQNNANSSTVTPTFRLRRYFTLYPVTFDNDGSVFQQPYAVDSVYVLDRLLQASPRVDILGPKPCPFSYYDKHGVNSNSIASGVNKYYGTNNAGWAGVNVDDIYFPNADSANSCSALLPVVNSATNPPKVNFITTNALNTGTVPTVNGPVSAKKVYIRPTRPWGPYYVEDTTFQACAPESFSQVDPPLFIASQAAAQGAGAPSGYCSVAYPNSVVASGAQIPLPSPAAMPNVGASVAPTTRAVQLTNAMPFSDPPLIAPPADINQMISSDPSYACQHTLTNLTNGIANTSNGTFCCAGGSVYIEANGTKTCTKPY